MPLFQLGQFQTFRAIDRDTVYIRGIGRQWYRVATMGPCPNLPWARALGLDTSGARTLDRFSTLIVEGDRCAVASVTRSAEPPRRPARKSR